MTQPTVVSSSSPSPPKPVIIAGAGPCGLTAALTLQQHGVPFVIIERASREKLCSNSGSGIDVSPSAVQILGEKLNVDMNKAMKPYDAMYVGKLHNKEEGGSATTTSYSSKTMHYTTYRLADLPNARDFGFANRSDIQNSLLDKLAEGNNCKDEGDILICNTQIIEYENLCDGRGVEVTIVTREDGGTKTESKIVGSALLACDGIHSAVRKHMHRNRNDDYNYIGQKCWWGKVSYDENSDLDREISKLESENGLKGGATAISFMGNHKNPGGFFSCMVAERQHAWVYFIKCKEQIQSNQSNDLVRRGGTVLTEDLKREELIEPFDETNVVDVVKLIVNNTKASDITRAGFFDRSDLTLPYVDGRVALLGDAAHPQSPMQGQGANMAIVDGYVVSTRLSRCFRGDSIDGFVGEEIEQALKDYDCPVRRKSSIKVIKEARWAGKLLVTTSAIKNWLMKKVIRYSPPSFVVKELIKGDKSNQMFLEMMDKDLEAKAAKLNENAGGADNDDCQQTSSSVES